jgi:very-short-patch-repair endonuclease
MLSHSSAAACWGIGREQSPLVEVTSTHGRHGRKGIRLHRGRIHRDETTTLGAIPITSVARTLFDLAEVVDGQRFERVFEEADRLRLLELRALERACERGQGRRGVKPIRKLLSAAREPTVARSPLEKRFADLCRAHALPTPVLNTSVNDLEADALWPQQRLIVELDGYAFHGHRGAFERDRARDAALLAAGYRVVRLTHRRLDEEGAAVAAQLHALLQASAAQPISE